MQVMNIPSQIRDYTVRFCEDLEFLKELEDIPNRLYVIDESVHKLYEQFLKKIDTALVLVLATREESKTLETVQEVYDVLVSRSAKKNATLIAVGGGVLQDIAGFAASTLYRGIRWIYVPTTLLAQCDSCIGGKTSLNYRGYKNLVGTFYPPHEIHISTAFLGTLSRADFYSGLGEMIKLHLMGGEKAVRELADCMPALLRKEAGPLAKAIRKSLEVKFEFMREDEFDHGRRNLLNFGHCFGHALEAVSDFSIPHGQAVTIGMLFANAVACQRGLLSVAKAEMWARDILIPNVVIKPLPGHWDVDHIYAAMTHDKKRTGEGLALIMMQEDHLLRRVADLTRSELLDAMRVVADSLNLGPKILSVQ